MKINIVDEQPPVRISDIFVNAAGKKQAYRIVKHLRDKGYTWGSGAVIKPMKIGTDWDVYGEKTVLRISRTDRVIWYANVEFYEAECGEDEIISGRDFMNQIDRITL